MTRKSLARVRPLLLSLCLHILVALQPSLQIPLLVDHLIRMLCLKLMRVLVLLGALSLFQALLHHLLLYKLFLLPLLVIPLLTLL